MVAALYLCYAAAPNSLAFTSDDKVEVLADHFQSVYCDSQLDLTVLMAFPAMLRLPAEWGGNFGATATKCSLAT